VSSKRLEMLEKMTASGQADSFAWYALALEYKGMGRIEDAHATFTKLREKDASYVPMYLMCGTMLIDAERRDEAREWLETGIEKAKAKGDMHALSELEGALRQLD